MTLDKLVRFEEQLRKNKEYDKIPLAMEIYSCLPSYRSMTTHPAYIRQMQIKHDFVIEQVNNGFVSGNIDKKELYKRFIEYSRDK